MLTSTAPAPYESASLLVRSTSAYDADGRIISVSRTNAGASQVTQTSYTRSGRPHSVTDPNGNKTTYAYDLNDRQSSVVQPASLNRRTRFTYDALGRLVTVVDNNNVTAEQYTYTANGLQASFIDARNNTTKSTYDGFDRLSQTTYAFGTAIASSESFTYDAVDNLKTRRTRKGDTISFAYDTLNRLITKTPPAGSPVVSYQYDLAGRITGVSDTSSAITAAVPPTGTAVSYATNATYDQLNRPTNVTWSPVATAATPAASSVTFTHGYNAANQRTSQAASDSTWLHYPTAGSSTSYTANVLNQYTAVGATTPTYDNNGNLTFDGIFTLGYDAENRLTSASGAGNTVTYAYDAQGRRKRKTVNGTITLYVTDADNREVLEYNGSTGQVQGWYAYGGQGEVVNRMDVPANTRQTMIPDFQGSVIATMESATGALTKRNYLPYGESASTTGSFGYTGLRIDAETNGLYYARARMYSPTWGRFLQPDPIGYAGGNNLYAYVGNDPLNFVDPTGEFLVQAGMFVAGGAIDIAAQMLVEGRSWSQLSLTDVALSGVAAAVTGSIGGRLAQAAYRGSIGAGQAMRYTAATGAVAGATASALSELSKGNAPDAGKMAIGFVGGGVGAGAGARVANAAASKLANMSAAGGVVGGIAATTRTATNFGRSTALGGGLGEEAGKFAIDAAAAWLGKWGEQSLSGSSSGPGK